MPTTENLEVGLSCLHDWSCDHNLLCSAIGPGHRRGSATHPGLLGPLPLLGVDDVSYELPSHSGHYYQHGLWVGLHGAERADDPGHYT